MDLEMDSLVDSIQTKTEKRKELSANTKYKICSSLFIFIILILQSVTLLYLITIANMAKNIDISSFNMTQQEVYIDKLKIIIDFVCTKYIQC